MNDALTESKVYEHYVQSLHYMFEVLHEHGWTINPAKRSWCRAKVDFLGVQVSAARVESSKGLIQRMSDLKVPRNRQELRTFLGLCIQLIPNQFCQHEILHELQIFRKSEAKEF